MKPLQNYNELLSRLGKATGGTTLVFLVALSYNGVIPQIPVPEELVPPVKGLEDIISWALKFGALPIVGAAIAWFLSASFEVHNSISKTIGLRHVWEKYFIVQPMLRRVGSDEKPSRERTKDLMVYLFYPEVKKIDQHYVQTFWRYAFYFWVMFEHFWVVLITILLIGFIGWETPNSSLFIYLGVVFITSALQWFFVVVKKSKAQAGQISEQAIRDHLV